MNFSNRMVYSRSNSSFALKTAKIAQNVHVELRPSSATKMCYSLVIVKYLKYKSDFYLNEKIKKLSFYKVVRNSFRFNVPCLTLTINR